MKVREKTMQLSLITFGLLLIILTYFIYPKINKKQFEAEKVVEIEQEENKEDSSVQTSFEGIKYKGESSTNSFTIQSEKAKIFSENPDLVYMDKMSVTIFLEDREIVITSEKGRYNKQNYNIFFEKHVVANDGKTILLSENLDLISAEDRAIIYNNVVIKDEENSLVADQIKYDFVKKLYLISMFNDTKVKVKIVE